MTVSGDHTRAIQIATPTVGGLMKFAVKTVTCLGCKTPLRANNSVKGKQTLPFPIGRSRIPLQDGAVCNNCRPRIGELYQKQVASTSELQVRFSRLWTQCQRCQGSLHQVPFRFLFEMKLALRNILLGCPVYKQGLSDFLHEEKGAKGCGRRRHCPRAF